MWSSILILLVIPVYFQNTIGQSGRASDVGVKSNNNQSSQSNGTNNTHQDDNITASTETQTSISNKTTDEDYFIDFDLDKFTVLTKAPQTVKCVECTNQTGDCDQDTAGSTTCKGANCITTVCGTKTKKGCTPSPISFLYDPNCFIRVCATYLCNSKNGARVIMGDLSVVICAMVLFIQWFWSRNKVISGLAM